jgi:AcrR family transcriptional regulator
MIARLGYAGASLRKIAGELGVAAPSILNMFKSKEQLLNELIVTLSARTLSFHSKLSKENLCPEVALYKIVYDEVISVASAHELTRLFYLPELRLEGFEIAQAQRAAMIANFRRYIAQGVENLVFRDVDCLLATEQIFQLTETSMIALDPDLLGPIELQAEAAADMALRGLLAKPARLVAIKKRAHACKITPDRSR